MDTHGWFVIFGILQLLHSQEEIWTGFHKKWFLFTMPQWVFVLFEVLFSAVIIGYMVSPHIPGANIFMPWFIFVMLLNGMWHLVWALVKKSYVPGLVTAPFFVVLFGFYYAWLLG